MPAQKGNNISISQIQDGLINPEFTSPTYVSATSFTVAGDVTSWLRPGRGLVISFQTSGIKRCVATSLSYDSGTNKTTINTVGDALVNETITSVLLSLSDGENIINYISYGLSKVRATRATAQTIPNATSTKFIFNTEVYDVLNEYDPSTGVFTAKNNGWYHVQVMVLYNPVTWNAGKGGSMDLRKNGDAYSVLSYHKVDAQINKFWAINGGDDIYLNKNDYIEIYVYQDSGSSVTNNGDANFNHLSIYRFG